jgi:hypothetical protein
MWSQAILVLVASSLVVLAGAFPLRDRLPRRWGNLWLAVGGAGLGIGGVMLVENPTRDAWVLAPLVLAVMTVIHVRMLFAGAGPMRTHR